MCVRPDGGAANCAIVLRDGQRIVHCQRKQSQWCMPARGRATVSSQNRPEEFQCGGATYGCWVRVSAGINLYAKRRNALSLVRLPCQPAADDGLEARHQLRDPPCPRVLRSAWVNHQGMSTAEVSTAPRCHPRMSSERGRKPSTACWTLSMLELAAGQVPSWPRRSSVLGTPQRVPAARLAGTPGSCRSASRPGRSPEAKPARV